MEAFRVTTGRTGGFPVAWLGRGVALGQVYVFGRLGERDFAFIIEPRRPEQRFFVATERLALHHRTHPPDGLTRAESEALQRLAERVLRREDELLALVAHAAARAAAPAAHEPRGCEAPLAGAQVFEWARPGLRRHLWVGARGQFALPLFAWSLEVRPATPALPADAAADVQQTFLDLVARFLAGGSGAGEPAPAEVRTATATAQLHLGRPQQNDEVLSGLDGQRGRLRVPLTVPTACLNRCVFCVSAALGETEPLVAPERALAEADRLLTALAGLADRFPEVDVCLEGGDALNFAELLPLLRRIRALPTLRELAAVAPATRLSERRFAAEVEEAGLRRIILTLFGPDARSHDHIAGRPGAHRDLLLSIAHAEGAGLRWSLNVLVVRQNLAWLGATLRAAAALNNFASLYVYVVTPDVPEALARDCMPRYRDIAAAFEAERETLAQVANGIRYMPLCVLPEFAQPLAGDTGMSVRITEAETPAACRRCSVYGSRCIGVGQPYVRLYGDDEFTSLP